MSEKSASMRIAIVSDIHGNLTAFDAVLADLRNAAPDIVFHGGDLADSGSSPVEVVDRIRDLGWPGVMGNTDEMLVRPESLTGFAKQSAPALQSMFAAIEEMAAAARAALGPERLGWLGRLPQRQTCGPLALVHASPGDSWRSPRVNAAEPELTSVYGPLDRPIVVYGHIHQSYVRGLSTFTIVNSGSVGLSYDGDPRAAYVLVENTKPTIRRVEYDLDKEIKALSQCGLPHADWIGRTLRTASPQML